MKYPHSVVLPPGVKETTGATFDRNHTYTYFTASSPDMIENSGYPYSLVAVNELDSEKGRDTVKRMLDEGRRIMLDSGIFNLAMEHVRKHNTTHDVALSMAPEEIDGFDKLWDQYAEIVSLFGKDLWGIVELDQGGVEHKPRTRARIEKELGIIPIPVYHPLLDGWDYYDDLAQEYDRICFGNIVQASPQLRLRLAHTAMERSKKYPYLWTHLLGMSQSSAALSVRMRGSMDSSSWLAPVRWQAQWRSYQMGTSGTRFSEPMWPHKGTYFEGPEAFDSSKGRAICNLVAFSQQTIFDAVLEDTHEDYSGRG